MPPGTSYAMTPTQQNKLFNFQEVPNANKIYGMGLEGLLDTSGANTLLTTNPKPSVAQSTAGRIIETRYIDRIYEQFKQATNIQLKKMYDNGNLKYEWRFALFGDVFSDKDKEAAIVKELSLGQKELIPEFLSYHSLSVSDALNICDWIDDTGLYQKFEALVNSFTSTTGADNKNGRPAADQNNIQSDGTDASLNSGGNTGDMRDFSTTSIYKCATCGEEIQKDSEFSPFCCTCYEKFIEIHADENLEE
jgi:DNA-directed RNA polymerase subunit RPC12/RpoP